ncbi:hypothetical protein [Staphylococcus simulans]|uniref:hypothetical protein n=1 Tax=Staphylococcus simulans TaxID=1286 RepID=UPI000710E410|nr:hypothetical protein [Staphylococcus simulans]
MKTKEFIASVENMGFKIEQGLSIISVKSEMNETLAYVGEECTKSMSTLFRNFMCLADEEKENLFKVIFEYASTPLEDREEPKKYRFRIKYTGKYYDYLNYDSYDEKWYFAGKGIDPYNKNEFTLEELPVWVHKMLEQGHLVKEEVE